MEINFDKKSFVCLQNVLNTVQNKTLSVDYRLSDDMPDVATVINAWGQCIIREKQWRGNEIEVSGGAKVAVLYKSASDASVRRIDSWVPFQFSMNVDSYEAEGNISARCCLNDLNVHINSPRKLDIQVDVAMCVRAYVPQNISLYQPDDLVNNIQILRGNYFVITQRESGEKIFTIDEELTMPASYPNIQEIVNCDLRLEITDKKVISQKAVFRGTAIVCITYLTDEGSICHWDGEAPFSQYTDLDFDYKESADIMLECALSGIEATKNDAGVIFLKAGVICQYTIFDTDQFETVKDAYCPGCKTELNSDSATFQALLNHGQELIRFEQTANIQANLVADVCVYLKPPVTQREGMSCKTTISGHINVLYYDEDSSLMCEKIEINKVVEDVCDIGALYSCAVSISGIPKVSSVMSGLNIGFDVLMEKMILKEDMINMIKAMEVDEADKTEPKPSIVICRKGADTLWDVAKMHNSTVNAIRGANDIENEETYDGMMVIPTI